VPSIEKYTEGRCREKGRQPIVKWGAASDSLGVGLASRDPRLVAVQAVAYFVPHATGAGLEITTRFPVNTVAEFF